MKVALAVVCALALGMCFAAPAFAHAEPATAKPGDGAVLTSRPSEVVFVMSQDMARQAGANDIDIFDAAGKEVTTIAAVVDNNDRKRLSVVVPSNLAPGKYTVKWKTLSADDGDPAEGQTTFTFDPSGTASPGKEQLREDLLGGETPGAGEANTVNVGGSESGVTWILVVTVGIAMFVLGAGGTFLLVQKRP